MSAPQVDEGLLERGEEAASFRIGVCREHVDAEHHTGLLELGRWLEAGPILLERLVERGRSEVGGEGIRQTQLGRELRAEQAGTQNPDRHVEPFTWNGAHNL